MRRLADFQQMLIEDILRGRTSMRGISAEDHPGVDDAFAVHRNSIFGALANALRLTYPTVEKLVGTDFFDQMAVAYSRHQPPDKAVLTDFVSALPAFVRAYPGAKKLAYLHDVARFDLALDQCAQYGLEATQIAIRIDNDSYIEFTPSLRCLDFIYPVDLIRDYVTSEDGNALSNLDMTPRSRSYAIWRGPAGAMAKALSEEPAALLKALLGSLQTDDAWTLSTLDGEPSGTLPLAAGDIVNASFAEVIFKRHHGRTT